MNSESCHREERQVGGGRNDAKLTVRYRDNAAPLVRDAGKSRTPLRGEISAALTLERATLWAREVLPHRGRSTRHASMVVDTNGRRSPISPSRRSRHAASAAKHSPATIGPIQPRSISLRGIAERGALAPLFGVATL